MRYVGAAVLLANFFAAIGCIALNKRAFVLFPFPAALTCVHYFVSWAGVDLLLAAGKFEARPVPQAHSRAFYALILTWSVCNALSNVSLERNSVGFYQLAKLMVTPSLVAFDFFAYGRRVTLLQGVALLLACIGVALASVSDVQLHAIGASVATAAVATAAAQKVLNSHVQQIGGLSSLQVMHNAFPAMALLSIAYVPLMDRRLHQLAALQWCSIEALGWIAASALAAFGATWSATLIFGLISALAHVLLGQVKTCSVILTGAVLYDARPTARGVAGASLALSAITAYSLLEMRGARGAVADGAMGASKHSGSDPQSEDEGEPLQADSSRR